MLDLVLACLGLGLSSGGLSLLVAREAFGVLMLPCLWAGWLVFFVVSGLLASLGLLGLVGFEAQHGLARL